MLTVSQYSLEMTSDQDVYPHPIALSQISFSGVTMTPGQRIVLRDLNDGLIAQRIIIDTVENDNLFLADHWFNGIKMTECPTGSVSVVITFR